MCSIRDAVHLTKGNCIMTDTIINVSSLSFGYAGSDGLVLEDITFDIKKGEVALIIGASGSGKTTLLKMLDKSMIPEGRLSGKAEYYGRQISSLSHAEAAVKIGYVGQNPDNQIVTDKVWHELAFGLENLGVPNADIRRRVAEMSEYFGITGWYDKNTEELSGGQKQLLNLASIMVMRPEVLLLDEPTAQLDPLAKKKFIDTVLELNKDFGITIMCVEHNLADIYSKADRVLVLEDGKLIYNGSPRKTAESLVKTENPLVYGLPSSVRIYEGCKEDITFETDCPLTVKEGREWVDGLNIKDSLYESRNKHYEAGETAVSVKNVFFRYTKNSANVLENISFDIEKGKITALLGSNGAGKTTLLRLMAGIKRPISGKVKVNGRCAVLPQNPMALLNQISVEEELASAVMDKGNSSVKNMDRKQRIVLVENMLERTGLLRVRKQHPYDLSGGQQQRLAFAKILLYEPDIILLDEPTKGIDPFFCKKMGEWLEELKNMGKTIVIVSHDVEFCALFADKCGLIFDRNIESYTDSHSFFAGNIFFTTDTNRIMSDFFKDCVTCDEAVEAIHRCLEDNR